MDVRRELKKRKGERFRVRCQVERYGSKRGFRGDSIETILLKDLRDVATGVLLCDHLWFTCGKWCRDVRTGETIEFDARVGVYSKGYQGQREDVHSPVTTDYRLERPTRVVKVEIDDASANEHETAKISGIQP